MSKRIEEAERTRKYNAHRERVKEATSEVSKVIIRSRSLSKTPPGPRRRSQTEADRRRIVENERLLKSLVSIAQRKNIHTSKK